MSTEVDGSLDSEDNNSFLSHRKNAVNCAIASSMGLVAMLVIIYVTVLNFDKPEMLASLPYVLSMFITASVIFVYSASCVVWYILEAIKDTVKD